MKRNSILTGALAIVTMLLINGCDDNKEELTSEENRYIHVGKNWAELSNMKSTKGYDIKVYSKSQKYKIGKEMTFEMTSKKDGLLYILYTSQKDKTMLLYPNDLSRDNTVKAGETITIPAKDNQWKMQASAPEGKSLLTFFVFPNKAMAEKKLKNTVKIPIVSKDLVLIEEEMFGVDSVTVEVVE